MDIPGISFLPVPAQMAVDPNRMDIAMFVGFLPLRLGPEAAVARARVAAQLAEIGWQARVDETGADLTDLPVRVRSLEDVERLFDTAGRTDRDVTLYSQPLPRSFQIAADEARFVLNVDGADQEVQLSIGAASRGQILGELATALTGIAVSEAAEINGKAAIEFRRTAEGAGSLSIYAHLALGFPVGSFDQSRNVGAPMGAALRSFFASGGREAVIVRMGDPPPLYGAEQSRVEALAALVGEGFGAGASSIADLLTDTLPQLPPEFPTRDPWHGLTHLHGLQDAAMVLLPDLPDLVATVAGAAREEEPIPRPKEIFQVCAPEKDAVINGEIQLAKPASVDAAGLELWSRIAVWTAEQVQRVTPEVMVISALPLVDDDAGAFTACDALQIVSNGNRTRGMAHRQLQIVTPWLASRQFYDLPANAAPADGVLAGQIAGTTLSRGAWRTVAGRQLSHAWAPYAAPTELKFDTSVQLSVIGYGTSGPQILSDRTTDPGTFNQANVRRLTALIFRAARHRGESTVFEVNGEVFWRDVAMTVTTLLRQLHSAGALRGLTEAEAFQVLCSRSTMSQADIDAGRAIAEVSFAPSHSLEFIEISLLAAQGSVAQQGAGQ